LGTATLVNPESEIIFAFAAGTFYALRLPVPTRDIAIAAGAVSSTRIGGSAVQLSMLGEEWVIGMGVKDAEEWWRSAFEYSANRVNS
jgi:hypothetical protein